MGLITITQMEDGVDASANLWNSRFGAIINEINGKLDSSNLADQAVTTAKIAPGAVTSDKIDTDKYIDANGWTVNDLGTSKTYTYTYVINNVTVNGLVRKDNLPTINPPVGRTNANIVLSATWYGGYSGHAVIGVEPSTTKIAVMFANLYPSALAFTGNIYITAVEAL